MSEWERERDKKRVGNMQSDNLELKFDLFNV